MTLSLPTVLTKSDAYLALSEKQVASIQARLSYVEEIAEAISSWLQGTDEFADIEDFLETVELDTAIAQDFLGFDSDLSNWVVHNSWGDGVTDRLSRRHLDKEIQALIDSGSPSLLAEAFDVNNWLQQMRAGIIRSLDGLSNSRSFGEVLSNFMAMDIILTKLLYGLYILRLRQYDIIDRDPNELEGAKGA